jgi:hypothetical protein
MKDKYFNIGCPACGYPDTFDGGHYKGIYSPGEKCSMCGYLAPAEEKPSVKNIADDLMAYLFKADPKSVVILDKDGSLLQRAGELSTRVYPPTWRTHAELLVAGMNESKAEGHPFRLARAILLVDEEGKYE